MSILNGGPGSLDNRFCFIFYLRVGADRIFKFIFLSFRRELAGRVMAPINVIESRFLLFVLNHSVEKIV